LCPAGEVDLLLRGEQRREANLAQVQLRGVEVVGGGLPVDGGFFILMFPRLSVLILLLLLARVSSSSLSLSANESPSHSRGIGTPR
jgi:hypothetical protein